MTKKTAKAPFPSVLPPALSAAMATFVTATAVAPVITPATGEDKVTPAELACQKARHWMSMAMTGESPWVGVKDLPKKIENGLPYQGINVPALIAQVQLDLRQDASDLIFGSYRSFEAATSGIKKGSKSISLVFAGLVSKKKAEEGGSKGPKVAPVSIPSKAKDDEDRTSFTVFRAIPTFHISQTNDYAPLESNAITERMMKGALDTGMMMAHAKAAQSMAQEHLERASEDPRNKHRPIGEGERKLVIRLAADLVVARKSGFGLEYAGELLGAYESEAIEIVKSMSGTRLMRPWGMAFTVLKAYDPELAQAFKDAEDANKAKNEVDPMAFFNRDKSEAAKVAATPEPTTSQAPAKQVVKTEVPETPQPMPSANLSWSLELDAA
jgi:hypothetical protein